MGIITTNPGVFDCILPQLCYTDWLSLCRCTCAWVCCLAVRVLFNVLFVSAGMCVSEAIFCFCTESFHCAVSFGWTAPSHLVLPTASIISSLNVVSYGGGEGNLSSCRYSKVFFWPSDGGGKWRAFWILCCMTAGLPKSLHLAQAQNSSNPG